MYYFHLLQNDGQTGSASMVVTSISLAAGKPKLLYIHRSKQVRRRYQGVSCLSTGCIDDPGHNHCPELTDV